MQMINEFFTSLYEGFFDYNMYKQFLDAVYAGGDYGKLGIFMMIASFISLLLFYKFWDPVSSAPRTKWLVVLFINALIAAFFTAIILYNNVGVIQLIGGFTNNGILVNPVYFIVQMCLITFLYSLIIAGVFSIGLKNISVGNKKNPF
jgi:hypothetical protein